MNMVCLDFEGVLVPDIWPHVARRSGVEGLKLTTRDVKVYRDLMDRRVDICHQNKITLKMIQGWISELEPLPGALEFSDWTRRQYQFVLLSDTFAEFVPHFMQVFKYPALFCHSISYNESTQKLEYRLRMEDQKAASVRSLRALNFKIFAAGDSYNDVTMLKEADAASFFSAPDTVLTDFPEYKNLKTYEELKQMMSAFFTAEQG